MKKKIFLSIIIAVELVCLFMFALGSCVDQIKDIAVLKFIYNTGDWYVSFIGKLMSWIHLDQGLTNVFRQEYYNVFLFFTLVLFNLVFVGIYYLIFGILTIVIDKKQEEKIRKVVAPYELTNNEIERFQYKNYLNRFPIRRVISSIIPIIFDYLFISFRFDKTVCEEANSKLAGHSTVSASFNEVLLGKFFKPIDIHQSLLKMMTNANETGYIDAMNRAFGKAPWIEYIVIAIGALLVVAIWFGFFTLINLMFRKVIAKKKSNKAKQRYIRKMEKIEYNLRKKYKDETSIKGDDFLHIVEKEQNDAAKEIAKFKNDIESEQNAVKNNEEKRKEYYEEIGIGVTDLGVSNESSEFTSPIVEREVKYIPDEEIDIILDEEPVIEIVEDNENENPIEFGKNDIFFEKYLPDDVEIQTIEDYSNEKYQDEVNQNDVEEENVTEEVVTDENEAEIAEETIVETPVEETIVETPVEEKVDETPKEEKTQNETEETIEETTQEDNEPVEEVIEEKTIEETQVVEEEVVESVEEIPSVEEESANVEESSIEDKTTEEPKEEIIEVEETDIIEEPVKKKYDPFAAYRNRKNEPGYGAKKVPSFKQIQEEKEKSK